MATGKGFINTYDHGTALEKNRVQCNYCGKVVSGITRLKCHLGGIRKDVVPCEKVPENVKEAFRNMLQEIKKEALAKEFGKQCQPDLPWKRNWSPTPNGVKHIKHEASQTAGCESNKQVDMDSGAEDGAAEYLPVCNRRVDPEFAINGEAKEDASSRQAKRCIGRFFYETGIDFSNANSPSFKRMLNTTLGDGQVKIPTIHEFKGWILWDELKETQEYVKKIRNSWASTGCSLLLDGWMNEKGQNLVSFVVEGPEGLIYLRSANVSDIINDLDALQLLLDRVMEEVGVDNVVQIIACSTTGWMGTIGKQFMDRRRTVFWSVSASHCIKLMLEKIGAMDCIKWIIEKAKIITKFIYGNGEVLKLMRNYTNSYDLVKTSRMKFGVPFLTLENIISEKKNLENMFASSEWMTSVWASSPEGKRVAHLMGDLSFWTGAEMTLRATVPLLRVLCLIIEADKPQVGFIYETMDQAKETIKEEFRNKKSQYVPFWEIIDEIWDTHLHSPLHAAGYYLNPSLFYSTDFYSDPEVSFGLLCCIVRMVQDPRTQDLISLQLDEYRHARGAFKEGSAINKRTNISPAQWWSIYGKQHPELQNFAIKILSQTCDGAMKFGLKRGLAEKLLLNGRNCNEQQRLDELTYVHYNLHLQNTQFGVEGGLGAEEIDPMDDWVVDKTLEIAPKIGGLEWMEADCTEATVNVDKPCEF
ncbi:uncharacterized protein LOC8287228 [Ricinus communis]|uniref:Protein dimerization, putative n=1 Tax=Ricinus communis TaxID=3988 RepID=B9SWK8_RICCO|nr:uncharacterized protein LOC8287228 [Ricinus communis]XP_015581615.1 uncharacterized protein LOC8287228 [Ricinus communis]XP_015581616.1 uncharacterized protein LOC8287228 [Ricinus communis]XP_015581617.1 uncharacterized protein LOC8287228 [Ricinus communis]XP_015581618.1 uncharacterized protein LOC8287228 [Ricinus communis]XP_048227346.1 uncharacterized protein LOC8287228 [Ricinus communis]EEF32010.1 protein dimerization, putative [Ricinus communis]|eukprot:XP_002530377.1 uncharacterized protein LOC8287228 [Ricinus communis]